MQKVLLCLTAFAMFGLQAEANQRTISTQLRASYLALELIDMRCPSQYLPSLLAELGNIQRGSYAIHHGFARKLLGKRKWTAPAKEYTLKDFREEGRAKAVELAHKYCTGAPDDRGPAIFFPLHLDIDVDNGPVDPIAGDATGAAAAAVVPAAVPAAVPDAGAAAVPDAGAAAITDGAAAAAAAASAAAGATPDAATPDAGAATEEADVGEAAASEAAVEEEEDTKESKKKKKKDDDDEDFAQPTAAPMDAMMANGPSMIVVMVLLVLVGVGIGIVGFKFVNKQPQPVAGQNPSSNRAGKLKKQLGQMKAALETQG